MTALVLKNISKIYQNGAVGVRNLTIEVSEGELMTLVGPSGSGKSTTLRMVAGLEAPTEGEVFIGGRPVNGVAPRDRDIAMVFQDYALYPHLNVEQNLGFGLKMRGFPKNEITSRVKEASQMLGIGDLLARKPKELSGGQRQRVALGRALVRKPTVFLFDEPLSNLDAALRVQLRGEIKEIHQTLDATMLYVTHDQSEAMAIGQSIAVMNEGAVEQVGAPVDIYQSPETRFVADFFGSPPMNTTEGFLTTSPDGVEIRMDGDLIHKGSATEGLPGDSPRKIVIGFRPEDITLGDVSEDNLFKRKAVVSTAEAMGAETLIHLEDGGLRLLARILGHADVKPGGHLEYGVAATKLHLFDEETGKRIRVN